MPTRRTFLRRSAQVSASLLGLGAASVGYGLWEATSIRIDRRTVVVPNLPPPFAGKTIAVLGDFHHGPVVSLSFIKHAVRLANTLQPDVIALVGDFAHRGTKTDIEMPPCLNALSDLVAPMGVYAVPGNHDMQKAGKTYREVIATTPLIDLTNRAVAVSCEGEALWLAGVDDLWWGKPDLGRALAGVPDRAAVVLLCHNPDFMEETPSARVGLALCGHTHGGQIYLPWLGASYLPSKYGDKYRHGLVQGPASSVFVTRGIGESSLPLRVNAPPEINLLTLAVA